MSHATCTVHGIRRDKPALVRGITRTIVKVAERRPKMFRAVFLVVAPVAVLNVVMEMR